MKTCNPEVSYRQILSEIVSFWLTIKWEKLRLQILSKWQWDLMPDILCQDAAFTTRGLYVKGQQGRKGDPLTTHV